MEVEVKLRLPDEVAYTKARNLFQPGHKASYAQENYFFDGTSKELTSQRMVLRLRFFNNDEQAVISVKGKAVLQYGIARATEEEMDVEPVSSRVYLEKPDDVLAMDSSVINNLKKATNVSSLECIGGFNNQREVFDWEGHTIELDATSYEWGTVYEIECETEKPEQLRDELETLLKQHDIQYQHSSRTKFKNFLHKTLG